MYLVLVRHGETRLNKEGRVLGNTDTHLTELGQLQARAAGRALMMESIAAIYSSPLPRALETAQYIAQGHGIEVIPLEGLKEADAGELDGLKVEEMRHLYPEFVQHWARDVANAVMPGGESLTQVQERAWNAVKSLLQRHAGDRVVAVTHNFTIHCILCHALGLPLSQFRKFRIDLGSVTVLRIDSEDSLVLESLNERGHLMNVSHPLGKTP